MNTTDNQNDYAWAAGVVSAMGSLTIGKVLRKKKYGYMLYTKYFLSSRGKDEMIVRLGGILEVKTKQTVAAGSSVTQLTINSDALHEAMKKMWPYLTTERKLEYKKIREMAALSKLESFDTAGEES